jgi:hypothetical protein
MLSTLVTGAAMVGVGYLIMLLGIQGPMFTRFLDRWVQIVVVCCGFAAMLWQLDYSFCACVGAHLWMIAIVIDGELMRHAEARQGT